MSRVKDPIHEGMLSSGGVIVSTKSSVTIVRLASSGGKLPEKLFGPRPLPSSGANGQESEAGVRSVRKPRNAHAQKSEVGGEAAERRGHVAAEFVSAQQQVGDKRLPTLSGSGPENALFARFLQICFTGLEQRGTGHPLIPREHAQLDKLGKITDATG